MHDSEEKEIKADKDYAGYISIIIKQSVYVFAGEVFMCLTISQKAHEQLNVATSNLPWLYSVNIS